MVYLLGRGATERRPVPIAASAAPLAAGPAVLPLPLGNHTIRAQVPPWASCTAPCSHGNLTQAPVDPVQFSAASKSQIGDEVWLFNNVFFNITAGFYLEMGGSDGVSNSNTRAFAQAANWRGMLIEADPDAYPKMVANRPDALCVHAAVCDDFKVRSTLKHARACGGHHHACCRRSCIISGEARWEVCCAVACGGCAAVVLGTQPGLWSCAGIYEFMSPGFKAFLTASYPLRKPSFPFPLHARFSHTGMEPRHRNGTSASRKRTLPPCPPSLAFR